MNGKKTIPLMLMATAAMLASGCASALTFMSPVQSEVVVKDKYAGPFAEYTYDYQIRDNRITLKKTPRCAEMAEAVKVSKKREIGYGPALIEMPFFGLGLFDIATAYAISDASRKVTPLEDYPTGKVLACGAPEPAADETVIIENRRHGIFKTANTDKNGQVDLREVLGKIDGRVKLVIRLASDQAFEISCTYEGGKSIGQTG